MQKMTKDDKIGPDFKKMRSVMKKIASFQKKKLIWPRSFLNCEIGS